MKNAVWIWIVRVISLCVLGPIAGGLMSSLQGVDGSRFATPMLSNSLMSGLLVLLGVFFLAMIAGVVASKAVSLREGVLNMGLVLGWGAWGAGQVGEALRAVPESGSLLKLAFEGALVLILTLWVLIVLTKASRKDHPHDECVQLSPTVISTARANIAQSMMLLGIGCAVTMVIVWLQVQTDLSGQAVWGGFIGSALAGVAGGMVIKNHSIANERSKEPDLSLIPVMVGVLLGGVLGPLLAMVMPGGGKILESIAAGDMPGYLVMSSLAWAAGALIGTPVGYSWVESSVARQHSPAQHA